MMNTTIPVPAGPDQARELRRLAIIARELNCACEVYDAPRLGLGGKSFHAYSLGAISGPIYQSTDPLSDEFDAYRMILGESVNEEAG